MIFLEASLAKLNKDLQKAIKKQTTKFLMNGKERKKMQTILQNEMRKGLREGEGYNGKELPIITTDWSERRQELIDFAGQKAHSKYSYGKSNVTFSGELVRNLFAAFKSITVKSIKFELFGSDKKHKRYKTFKGKSKAKQSSNEEIVAALQSRGWKILGVYPNAKKRIINQFKRFLRRNS
jgi:hypothetical protein